MSGHRVLKLGGVDVHAWLATPPGAEVLLALERLARLPDVAHIAVMPDVHLAEDVCVGTVVATRSTLIPAAVGGDIGCGMAALRFDVSAGELRDRRVAANVLGELGRRIPTLHRLSETAALPAELLALPLSHPSLEQRASREGRIEFGTLGRGNHFVELQADDEDRLWVMLHSGSRAMGPAIREHHARLAMQRTAGFVALEASTDEGKAYLSDVSWAIAYAEASRRRMLDATTQLLGDLLGASPDPGSLITCQHNHVRTEVHGGETLWVHRKGALHAGVGVRAVIPGSMGRPSVHVEGRGFAEALSSSSHGAGRTMSRTEARRRIGTATVLRELDEVWFDHRLSAALRDESPSAYRDLGAVMRAQGQLTKAVRTLRPVLSYKGV